MESHRFEMRYIPALDGLRGIAVLLVMAFHAEVPFLQGGFVGVDVFFALSGFLITALLLKEHSKSGRISFRNFYIRRALRLLPALFTIISAVILMSFIIQDAEGRSATLRESLATLFYVSNWVLAFDLFDMYFLAHSWSLAIEEQFYILWPMTLSLLMALRLKRNHLFTIIAALGLASWGWRMLLLAGGEPVDRVYFALDTRLDGLLLGSALAVLLSSNLIKPFAGETKRTQRLGTWVPFGALALMIGVCILPHPHPHFAYQVTIPLVVFVSLIILYFVTGSTTYQTPVERVLSHPALIYLGRISYGLYLWHLLICRIVYDKLNLESWVLGTLLSVSAALIAASLSYFIIEKPALSLKDRFQFKPTTANSPVSQASSP
ncbi:MAG: acyltransferase [bacterium]|nr:acyltransferase [bacterium]